MSPHVVIEKVTASDDSLLAKIRELFLEYSQSLDVDLCFQNFDRELQELPGDYAEPKGVLLLALMDGKPAGCGALRALKSVAHSNTAEMKRLYVRPEFRGNAIGKKIVLEIIQAAKNKGYNAIVLDTLNSMTDARTLYASMGFVEIAPYYDNPLEGTQYLRLDLSSFRQPHQ